MCGFYLAHLGISKEVLMLRAVYKLEMLTHIKFKTIPESKEVIA